MITYVQLLDNSPHDDLDDVNLEEEEEEKNIIYEPKNTATFNTNDEYDDSEDIENDEDDEKYSRFRQISYIFNDHESIWDDDMLPSCLLAFLFVICAIISYIGYTQSNGENRFTATITSFSIWSIITIIFIIYDRNKSEHENNKKLQLKNINQYDINEYRPYYTDDDDDDDDNHNIGLR